jgi:hypothetical protein
MRDISAAFVGRAKARSAVPAAILLAPAVAGTLRFARPTRVRHMDANTMPTSARIARICLFLVAAIALSGGPLRAANAACPDEATARQGYKFEDSSGATGEVQFKGADQDVAFKSRTAEIHQRFTNNGHVMLASALSINNRTSQQTYTFAPMPPVLDAVGKTAEYVASMRAEAADGRVNTATRFDIKRKVIAAERVTIGECSYDTLVLVAETERSGDMAQKLVTRMNWSPVLARFVKAETTITTPPADKPVVTNWAITRVGF